MIRASTRFREVDPEMFHGAWKKALLAVRERPRLTEAEFDAGWHEDPDESGLRWNAITGEWDDSCFVHLGPRRPSCDR